MTTGTRAAGTTNPPRLRGSVVYAWLLLLLIAAACAAPVQSPGLTGHGGESQRAVTPKRLVAATKNVPSFLYYKPHPGPTAGAEEIGDLLNAGLVIVDDRSLLRPQLAEAVPSIENGLWRLLPDGRMETTVTIKPGAQWHDGAPFTADDLAFTLLASRDQELAALRHVGFDSIEDVIAVDTRTLRVHWKRPYIEADALFSTRFALPLPRHLLEKSYVESRAGFLDAPYFTHEFVGTGPFRFREYVPGSFLLLQANDAYALGRPKLDELEVRFITDDNTYVANLLAGAVGFTLGRGPSLEQALLVRDQWTEGRVEFKSLDSWLVVYPQFVNPQPAVVGNPQFRRALLHAVDRQEMVDSIQGGLVPVADGNISPNHPMYVHIEGSIVRHPYDLRRAGAIIEGLGYTRDSDGWRDAANQRLAVVIRGTTVLDILPKATHSVADYWKRLGVQADADIRSSRALDQEQTATFPAFVLQRQTGSARFLPNLRSAQARLPERGFAGNNIARYVNPEMDALVERYLTTIPVQERAQVIAQIVRKVTGEVIWLTLFFDTEPSLIANRVANVYARGEDSNHAWNAHEWDVR